MVVEAPRRAPLSVRHGSARAGSQPKARPHSSTAGGKDAPHLLDEGGRGREVGREGQRGKGGNGPSPATSGSLQMFGECPILRRVAE
eukprot:scaffold169859_cov33-Tisochrysis_lutea.AAC.1